MGLLQDKNQYAKNISILRYDGKINEAITQCKIATVEYPTDNFFFKILGDLYMDIDCYEEAASAYLENLKRMNRPELFRTFVRFYGRIRQKVDEDFLANYQDQILVAVKRHEISCDIARKIAELWKRSEFIASPKLHALALLSDSDTNFEEVKRHFNELSNHKDLVGLSYLLQYRVNSSVARRNTKKIDTYLVQVLERHEQYKDAQVLLEKMVLDPKICTKDIIASFLRVCRKQSDYSDVKKCLTINNDFISNSDFNIQYELVYFFEALGDIDGVKTILGQMKVSATRSPAISRTLYNFYLRFNMFDEANAELSRLSTLLANRRRRGDSRIEEQQESEQAVWQKLKDLVSEQEHNRQYPAGVVYLVAQKQQAQQHRHIQGICPPQAQQLIPQPLPPEALIQPEGGVGEELDGGEDCPQGQILGQGHRDDPVGQEAEAYPERGGQGQIQHRPVCQDVQPVQQPLVFFYHALSLFFRVMRTFAR